MDLVTPKRDAHFYWTLFKSTFLISAFTVGGGFVIIPLLKGKYVDEYHWISDKDTLDCPVHAGRRRRQQRRHLRLSHGRHPGDDRRPYCHGLTLFDYLDHYFLQL